jgi:hypothetical protein
VNRSKIIIKSMSETPDKLPQPKTFFLEVPLYRGYSFGDSGDSDVLKIQKFSGTLDVYCPECQQESVFLPEPKYRPVTPGNSPGPPPAGSSVHRPAAPRVWDGAFIVEFSCSRIEKHKLYFCFRIQNRAIMKIGQHPSVADFSEPEVKKYRKVLGEERYKEFNRAIGLTAYGVGIGSFVYLRRIFEKLIEEAHVSASKDTGWDEEQYKNKRMDEKISLLSNHLPSFLSDNRGLYSILSKGIHDLSEEECLTYFQSVKIGIELILDETIERMERLKKIKNARHSLSKIKEGLS